VRTSRHLFEVENGINDHGLSLDQLDDLNQVAEAKDHFDRLQWDFVETVKTNGPNSGESWDKLLEDVEEHAVKVEKVCRSMKGPWHVGGDERSAVVETFRDGVEDGEIVPAEATRNTEDRSANAEESSENVVEIGKETVHNPKTDVEVANMEPIEEYDPARELRFVHDLMRTGELNLVEGVELLQELREPMPEPITDPALQSIDL